MRFVMARVIALLALCFLSLGSRLSFAASETEPEDVLEILVAADPKNCGWAVRLAESQLLNRLGQVMRSAAKQGTGEGTYGTLRNNPFRFNPHFYLSRAQGRIARVALVESQTGIVLTVEENHLVARYSRSGRNTLGGATFDLSNVVALRFPFPAEYRLWGSVRSVAETFQGRLLPGPRASWEYISHLLEHKIVGPLLKTPTDLLSDFFEKQSDQLGDDGYEGLSVFPVSLMEKFRSLPAGEKIYQGIQMEGIVRIPLDEGDFERRYGVIQAVVRHGSFQIWWSDTNGRVRYSVLPLNWAFHRTGNVRQNLLAMIYRHAISLAKYHWVGEQYIREADGLLMSASALTLSDRMGWVMTDLGRVPLNYLGKPVLVRSGRQATGGPLELGRVIRAGEASTAPNGALRSELTIESGGQTFAVSSRSVFLLDTQRLRRRMDPLIGGSILYEPGMKVVEIRTGAPGKVIAVGPRMIGQTVVDMGGYTADIGGSFVDLTVEREDGAVVQTVSAEYIPEIYYASPEQP